MITEPKLEQRDEQPYVAIRTHVTMQDMVTVLPQHWSEAFAWLERQGMAPAGAPFIRYLVIDMDAALEIEVGVPVPSVLSGDARIRTGVLPAGRYATLIHTGHYSGLVDATAALLAWAEGNGIVWQTATVENDTVWGARLEFYLTDPANEPNPEKWETELAFLVADDRARQQDDGLGVARPAAPAR
jgi:effector-binding domain-containing protein